MPGAIRASAGINTTGQDVTRLLAAVARIASSPPPIEYRQDQATGDYHPCGSVPGQPSEPRMHQAPCLPAWLAAPNATTNTPPVFSTRSHNRITCY